MIVYGSTLSPFVRKVMAYGAEKGLALTLNAIGLGSDNPEFLRASPFGKMPGFTDGSFAISDSTAIITYLEAKFPQPFLLPGDPALRARTIWYEEFADTMLTAALGKIFFNTIVSPMFLKQPGNAAAIAEGHAELPRLLDYLEANIPPSQFLVGDTITLADVAVASPFVNYAHCGGSVDAATHPRLAAWLALIHARPSFAAMIAEESAMLAKARGRG